MRALGSTASAAGAIKKVNYTHDAVIDLIIARPDCTQNTIAAHFGYSTGWLSRVMCSDAFQARLAERRTEVVNPELVLTFEERLRGLATQSLNILTEKLEPSEDPITGQITAPDPGIAFKCLELSAKALGYGARQTNVAIQNNITNRIMTDDQLMAIAAGR